MKKNRIIVRLYRWLPTWIKSYISRVWIGAISTGACEGLRISRPGTISAVFNGSYEKSVQDLLSEKLCPGDVVYDIGANIGFFSLLAATRVGTDGFVYSFEPIRENAKRIKLNMKLNRISNFQVLELAISDSTGEEQIWKTSYSGGATLISTGVVPPDAETKIVVETASIDDLVARGQIRQPSMIKLDVEGAEMEALKGMSGTLSKYMPLIVYELDDANETAFSAKIEKTRSFLLSRGYRIRRIEDSYPQQHWNVAHFFAQPSINDS